MATEIAGAAELRAPAGYSRTGGRGREGLGYAAAALAVALATLIAHAMAPRLAQPNLIMVYLSSILLVAVGFGRGPSILAAILSTAAFDFYFVPPIHTLTVEDTEYLVTLAVMLGVGLLTSESLGRLRQQAGAARLNALRAEVLYRLGSGLSRAIGRAEIVRVAEEAVGELLGADVWILLPDAAGRLEAAPGVTSAFPIAETERDVARRAFERARPAGRGTEDASGAHGRYTPILGTRGAVGVLGIFRPDLGNPVTRDEAGLIESVTGQLALVLERDALAREAEDARVRQETVRLREAILSAVSHDLRTPLATIVGATSSLVESGSALPDAARRDLLQSIWDEAERMNRLVVNLLNMGRLRSGALVLVREWQPLDEVIGSALGALSRRLGDRPIAVRVAPDLPLVSVDGLLVEQVLVNLVDNAVRHAGEGGPIEIAAEARDGEIVVSVSDRGPGIPKGRERDLFGEFRQGGADARRGGFGLGLAICRGIVLAHGGTIRAENRDGGGATVSFTLPIDAGAPSAEERQEGESP